MANGIRCRSRSMSATHCSAVTARPARSWLPPTCFGTTRTPLRTRFVRDSKATCADAPATSTSSTPCSKPLTREWRMSEIDPGVVAVEAADQISAPDGTKEIGRRRLRKEDAKLVTGQTQWTDNIQFAGMLHLAILRSPMAHAKVKRVDVSPALKQPGVIAAFSGAASADEGGSLPCGWRVTEDMKLPAPPPIAVDEVRYVGDAVAVVVARDRYAAADALEAIEIDYDPLPAVTDMEEALKDEALVHSDKGTNKCFLWPFAGGDYDAAKAKADVVVNRRYIQQRLIPNAMEPRAVVVAPIAAADEYTIYSATQIPHILRVMLALV